MATLAQDFFLPPGYLARQRPRYFVDSVTADTGITHQPDVYTLTAHLARGFGCVRVIDVGCGQAQKLMALPDTLAKIGLDFGDNIAFCRQHYGPRGQWIEADLERAEPLPLDAGKNKGDASILLNQTAVENN